MARPTRRSTAAAVAFATLLGACGTAADPGGLDASGASGRETVVRLSQESGTGAASRASLADVVGGMTTAAGKVALADVKSIDVTITRVQALPTGANENAEGGWVSLTVASGGKLNLLALPTQAANAIQLARGTLPAGGYQNLRLLFTDDATITFARDVTAGGGAAAVTYKANTAYPLDIPGASKPGIKVPLGTFTVPPTGGATIDVTFSGSATVGSVEPNVVATPHGVKMTPVLVARGKAGSGT